MNIVAQKQFRSSVIGRLVPYLSLFSFALVLRCFYRYWFPLLSRDSIFYLEQIMKLRQSGWAQLLENFEFYTPPLFLQIMQLGFGRGISLESWGCGVNIVAGALLCPVIYGIVLYSFHNTAIAFICGLLTASSPYLVEVSTQLQRESLFLLFYAASIFLFILYCRSGQMRNLVLSVGVLALATLIRYEGIVLLILFLGYLWFGGQSVEWYKRLYRMAALAGLFVLWQILIFEAFRLPFDYWWLFFHNRIKEIYF